MIERKIFRNRVIFFGEHLNRVLYDAYVRIDEHRRSRGLDHPYPEEVNLFSWPQEWPNSAAGFDEAGTPGPVVRQTCVVKDERTNIVYVYHDWRFVRSIENPTSAFWQAVRDHALPGFVERDAWARLCSEKA